ncbi:MAG: cephalosporin hydroxylase family protein [Planctomycetota bacterium]
MSDPTREFYDERSARSEAYKIDNEFSAQSRNWLEASMRRKYVYDFDWLGRPIIQYPQDIVALQEIIWSTRPDVIIETGIAHGGSLVLSASMLALLDLCDATTAGVTLDPSTSRRHVIGIDIDIRPHNRQAIEAHPLANRIKMIEGSSIDPAVVDQVGKLVGAGRRVMVCLDSMHTHDHVLAELRAYAPMVTTGCYCVVFDTFVADVPKDVFLDRPWGPGNNPKTAVHEFLKIHAGFEIDVAMHTKLQITVAPDGYLRRVA